MTAQSVSSPGDAAHHTRHDDVTINTPHMPVTRALRDIRNGALLFHVWGTLAWSDIRRRYKRSVLGPIWITLSLAIFVGALGYLYAHLFNRDLTVYMPHLTVGYICWTLLSQLVDSGARCFISGEGIVKQLNVPVSVHAYRIVWSSLLTSAHHVVVYVIVAIAFAITPTLYSLMIIPGLALIVLTGVPIALLLGTISARFRDLPLVLQSIMRIMLFLTPVIWQPELVSRRAIFLTWNPLYHYIELIRSPLLNTPFNPFHWQFAMMFTLASWIIALAVFIRFRARIAYWL